MSLKWVTSSAKKFARYFYFFQFVFKMKVFFHAEHKFRRKPFLTVYDTMNNDYI